MRSGFALGVGLLGLVACGGGDRGAVPTEALRSTVRREAGLDVLLITVDTLRADALGSYGNQRAETPWMDRLAAAGVRFDFAHAHNVVTLPTHASILSGLNPHQHGVRDNSGFRFPDDLATLATVLADEGYRTGAFVSAFPLDSRFGLDRGFEIYEDSFTSATARPAFLQQERPGSETVTLARRWLAAGDGRPTFCWVHVYEPHYPYRPPEPLAGRFRDAPYHGDVAAADFALAPLLEALLVTGESGRTLVVLTSDHGEALGEHGEATHGIFAYEETLAVPLILYQPRLFPSTSISTPARHVDILPTVLDALGLSAPTGLAGRSLLPVIAGVVEESPPTYFEALSGQLNRGWAPLHGVIQGGYKYIDLPIPELYALGRDPDEEDNLAGREPERVAELAALLGEQRAVERSTERSPESDETRRRLAALGYLSAETPESRRAYTPADDPKRLLGLDAALREVVDLHAAGDLAGALERSRRLVRERPGMRIALVQLAQLERESGNLEAAIEALRAAYDLQPGDTTILAGLAASLTRAGRAEEAAALTEPHARESAPDVEVLLTRGLALMRAGRPDEALATFERAGAIDPDNPMVAVHVGTYHLVGGRRAEARAAYRRALAMQPGVTAAHTALAVMAGEEGRIDEALAHWRDAVASDPREHRKLLAVGYSGWTTGRRTEARRLLELFVELAPPDRYGQEIERVRSVLSATGSAGTR